MKRFFLGIIIGAVLGVFGWEYFRSPENKRQIEDARAQMAAGAERLKQQVRESVGDVTADDIREELSRTSMIVREKARQAGGQIADATVNARVTAAIKARFLKEPGVASLKINVDTTDGLVTLSGTASSHEEIARLTKIALETEGVHKVISTLQVRTPAAQ